MVPNYSADHITLEKNKIRDFFFIKVQYLVRPASQWMEKMNQGVTSVIHKVFISIFLFFLFFSSIE